MRDQRPIWEASYQSETRHSDSSASDFAVEVEPLLPSGSRVLEVGCGTGTDAAHFASRGHSVVAVDLSRTAIDRARRTHDLPNLCFEQHDCAVRFEYPDASFDAVYARLSLHYFSDSVTRAVFAELRRLLAPAGLLAFICKSTDDVLYGRGVEMEKDVFEHDHLRHFFSERYARECLEDGFGIESLESLRGPLYGRESAYIKVIARRDEA